MSAHVSSKQSVVLETPTVGEILKTVLSTFVCRCFFACIRKLQQCMMRSQIYTQMYSSDLNIKKNPKINADYYEIRFLQMSMRLISVHKHSS